MPKQKITPLPKTYRWKGINKQGESIRGESNALSLLLLKADLRRQGITPKNVRKKLLFSFSSRKKISSKTITLFIRQLATMLTAGIPIIQAFELIAQQQTHPTFQYILQNIKIDIEAGNTPSAAFAKYPTLFNALLCHLTAAGEQSGTLDTMLARIAHYREKTERLATKIKKALLYPSTVIAVAIIVTTILMIFVVPQFESLFKGFGAELPAMTRLIMQLSHLINTYILFLLGLLLIMIIGFVRSIKYSKKFAYSIDALLLRLPLVGTLLTKAIIARFARTLSTLFAAGLPILDALRTVAGVTGNRVYEKTTLTFRDQIATGLSLHSAIQTSHRFPAMALQMIAIGETSGTLESMLAKIADFYEAEVDHTVDNLSTLLEPAILVILGIFVGGLVIAMYLPIFQLGNVV